VREWPTATDSGRLRKAVSVTPALRGETTAVSPTELPQSGQRLTVGKFRMPTDRPSRTAASARKAIAGKGTVAGTIVRQSGHLAMTIGQNAVTEMFRFLAIFKQ
jgi:hypothetical protein